MASSFEHASLRVVAWNANHYATKFYYLDIFKNFMQLNLKHEINFFFNFVQILLIFLFRFLQLMKKIWPKCQCKRKQKRNNNIGQQY